MATKRLARPRDPTTGTLGWPLGRLSDGGDILSFRLILAALNRPFLSS